MNLRDMYIKYKDLIPYTIFGVLTTVVNILVYWGMAHLLGLGVMPSTIIAWILAVLFAYITNRKWVFCSDATSIKAITKEVFSFFVCRLVTGVIDWTCMFVFVDMMHLNDVIIKTLANVMVIILNYFASKVIIFAKQKK